MKTGNRGSMSKAPRPSGWRKHLFPVTTLCVLGGIGFYLMSPASALRLPALSAIRPSQLLPALQPEPQPALPAVPELPPTGLFQGTASVPVLMYHDVIEQPGVYFDVSVAEFKQQLAQLKKAGATVIPLADLYDHLRDGKELPPRAVVLTFDDGYLGLYDTAYPLLKEYGYPATFFVHTGVVGVKTGKDHMKWEQLQALDKEGLISIESHTVSHPDDLRKCSDQQLARELIDSKKILEQKLGRKMRFLAYPVGNADGRVARVAREAGYEMAFTMGPGWARAPADTFFVPRMLPKYLPEVWARFKAPEPGLEISSQVLEIKPSDLESGFLHDGQVKMRWVCGGKLSGVRMMGRKNVPTVVRAAGAVAGLNGTFFSDARVNSEGAGIVGPILTRFGPGFAPGLPGDRERIAGRPLVLISPERMAFLPFQPHLVLDRDGVERLLPGATECFIGGAWLVHQGQALTREQLESFRLENVFDFRPRAFVGIDREGRPFLGASATGNQSDRLAETLVKAGLQECVLLDSGFSTSLVLGREVLISGYVRKDVAARPVPHFLVLHPVDATTKHEVLALERPDPSFVGPPVMPSLVRLQSQLDAMEASPEEPETANGLVTGNGR
jgi:poly-beta-1,6-N-acetyl-D-glucosamine N-deacetylase